MQKQGSSVSAEIQRHELSVVDEYKKTQFMTMPIGVLAVKDSSNKQQHVPPTVINETLDKWMVDAKLRMEDGTIKDIAGVSRKVLEYNKLINGFLWTAAKKVSQVREDEILLSRTTQHKEMQRLREENAVLRRQVNNRKQKFVTTINSDDVEGEEAVQNDEEVVIE